MNLRRLLFSLWSVVGSSAIASVAHAQCDADPNKEPCLGGHAVFIEEDALLKWRFASLNEDRNYTAGMGLQWNGRWTRPAGILQRIPDAIVNRFLGTKELQFHSLMLSGTAFTPDSLNTPDPLPDDRPYASLVAISTSRLSVENAGRRSVMTQLVIGELGSQVGRAVQTALHGASRALSGDPKPYPPLGWKNQIANGGRLAIQYSIENNFLLLDGFYSGPTNGRRSARIREGKKWLQLSGGWEATAGSYYDNIGIQSTLRLGEFTTRFWEASAAPLNSMNAREKDTKASGESRNPAVSRPRVELPRPTLLERLPDVLIFGTVRPKYWLYNALLEGQGAANNDKVRIPRSQLESVVTEFELGITVSMPVICDRSLTFTMLMPAGRTPEFKPLNAPRRNQYWASFFFSVQSPDPRIRKE